MNNYYFTFRSVTQAQNALFVLRSHGITGGLVHAPIGISPNGCSYAVEVKSSDGYLAAAHLRREGIMYIQMLNSVGSGMEGSSL